jgi:nitrate/nitrite-specific signal transduction histidine kinase
VLGLRLDQLARMLRQLGSSHSAWRKRVRDAQRLLSQTKERLALHERGEAQRLQRDRILRELHDEMGHRLMSAMTLTQQIGSSPAHKDTLRPQLQRLLDNSLIELRLAYEALEVVPRPLTEALNELRMQLEPTLDEAQVDLRWVVDTRAAMLVLPTAETLQLLRIVREALSPMIERVALGLPHALAATLCKVTVDVPDGETGRHLRLRISDEPLSDGPEVAEPLVRLGTSWIKLQRQATALGAQLALDPQAGERRNGWSLELVMSLAGR